ncbi:MAG: hypothetical protein V4610_04300 [Pseudomonadota bacterium]|jgi:hypothetical protein
MLLAAATQASAHPAAHKQILSDPHATQIDWWRVQILFSGLELSGLAEWMTDANTGGVGSTLTKGLVSLIGGTPVSGTLRLKSDGLHFSVDPIEAALTFKNVTVTEIFIPKRDIVSAKATPSFFGISADLIGPHVQLRTRKGDLTIMSRWSSGGIARSISTFVEKH